jgi:hypothetical protein
LYAGKYGINFVSFYDYIQSNPTVYTIIAKNYAATPTPALCRDENGRRKKPMKFCVSRHHCARKITKIQRIKGFLKSYGL